MCVKVPVRARALEEHSPDTEPERKLSGPRSQRGIGGSRGQADKQIRLSGGDRTHSAKTYLEVLLYRLHLGLAPQTKIHNAHRCPPLLFCAEKPISNLFLGKHHKIHISCSTVENLLELSLWQAKSVFFLMLLKAPSIQKLHTCQIYIP